MRRLAVGITFLAAMAAWACLGQDALVVGTPEEYEQRARMMKEARERVERAMLPAVSKIAEEIRARNEAEARLPEDERDAARVARRAKADPLIAPIRARLQAGLKAIARKKRIAVANRDLDAVREAAGRAKAVKAEIARLDATDLEAVEVGKQQLLVETAKVVKFGVEEIFLQSRKQSQPAPTPAP
ncbi:MAG: hypothetical protein ACLQNE_30140 [Thermoguttaceae bacterium]